MMHSTRAPLLRSPANLPFVIALAVLLGLHLAKALIFLADGQPPLKWDCAAYWRLGQTLADGKGFSDWLPERPPAYPLFLGACLWLFGERALVAVAAFQQLAVVATALLSAWICGRLTKSRVGFLLGLALALVCVERHYLATYVISDGLFGLELAVGLALLVLWLERPSLLVALSLGLTFGLATLTRPAAQLAWIPVLAAMALRLRGQAGASFLRHAGCAIAAMVIVVAPWFLRNQQVHGEPFLTKFSGRSSWISVFEEAGLPFADGRVTSGTLAALASEDVEGGAWAVHGALRRAGYGAIEADDRMRAVALEAVREHPLAFASSVAQRFRFFWISPWGDSRWRVVQYDWSTGAGFRGQKTWELPRLVALHDRLHANSPPLRQRLYLWTALASLLAVGFMALARDLRLPALAVAMLSLYLAAVTATMTGPLYRFRMVLEPYVVVVVVCGALHGQRILSTRLRRLGAAHRRAADPA